MSAVRRSGALVSAHRAVIARAVAVVVESVALFDAPIRHDASIARISSTVPHAFLESVARVAVVSCVARGRVHSAAARTSCATLVQRRVEAASARAGRGVSCAVRAARRSVRNVRARSEISGKIESYSTASPTDDRTESHQNEPAEGRRVPGGKETQPSLGYQKKMRFREAPMAQHRGSQRRCESHPCAQCRCTSAESLRQRCVSKRGRRVRRARLARLRRLQHHELQRSLCVEQRTRLSTMRPRRPILLRRLLRFLHSWRGLRLDHCTACETSGKACCQGGFCTAGTCTSGMCP